MQNTHTIGPNDRSSAAKRLGSRLEEQTLFWSSTPSREERNLKFARFGSFVTTLLLIILSIVEISFFACLLWQFIR